MRSFSVRDVGRNGGSHRFTNRICLVVLSPSLCPPDFVCKHRFVSCTNLSLMYSDLVSWANWCIRTDLQLHGVYIWAGSNLFIWNNEAFWWVSARYTYILLTGTWFIATRHFARWPMEVVVLTLTCVIQWSEWGGWTCGNMWVLIKAVVNEGKMCVPDNVTCVVITNLFVLFWWMRDRDSGFVTTFATLLLIVGQQFRLEIVALLPCPALRAPSHRW